MAGFLGNGPTGAGRASRFQFAAAAAQTTFSGIDQNGLTLNYKAGYVEVAVGGYWIPPSDYTATDGSSIVLGLPCNASDVVYVYALAVFNAADTYSKVQNGADVAAGYAANVGAVAFNAAQSLSAAQQTQARSNIAAATTPATWTRTVITSGSGTYNRKTGCTAINIRMVGGGGGGGGTGTGASGGTGGTGGTTTFGASLLTANGGAGGSGSGSAQGGVGGTASGGDINIPGGLGGGCNGGSAILVPGGNGGNSYFGGGQGITAAGNNPGSAAAPNTGGGGAGASLTTAATLGGGCGGGAGAYCEKLIGSPAASYSYAVGAGGAFGAQGTSGQIAGAGGSGIIIIDEYY